MDAAGLFERHYRLIVAYMARRVHDHEQDIVEDLAQEVFIKAHRFADRYEDRGLSETCWLYKIARTVLVDHARKRLSNKGTSRNVSLELLPSHMEPAFQAPAAIADGALDVGALLAQLTPMQRAVIECRFLQDLKIHETSAAMGTSEEAVKKLQARALANLRRMIEADRRMAA